MKKEKKQLINKNIKIIEEYFGTTDESVKNSYMTPNGKYLITPSTNNILAEHAEFADEILSKIYKGEKGFSGEDMSKLADMIPIHHNKYGEPMSIRIYKVPTIKQLNEIERLIKSKNEVSGVYLDDFIGSKDGSVVKSYQTHNIVEFVNKYKNIIIQ